MVELVPIKSSNVEAVGFDGEAIAVKYKGNATVYRYTSPDPGGVSQNVFDAIFEAPSAGRFIQYALVRNKRVACEKVPDGIASGAYAVLAVQ